MSSEFKHTPGPWSYRSQHHDDWGVVRAGRYWICQAKDPAAVDDAILAQHRIAKTDPWEANARLIAASPELLEAARIALGLIADGRIYEQQCCDGHMCGCQGSTYADEAEHFLRAAIAKATGQ